MSKNIWLAKAPAGPVRRTGLEHICSVYVIWKFAENIKGAKQFLVDYIGSSREAFLGSELYNFPTFPNTVSDLDMLIANDSNADPPDKYKVLKDAEMWTTNVGDPGYANAATDEIFGRISSQPCLGKLRPMRLLLMKPSGKQRQNVNKFSPGGGSGVSYKYFLFRSVQGVVNRFRHA